jgi:hypothetical protein
MRLKLICLSILFILMFTGVAAAELPAGIDDGNYFYQEITVISESTVNNATINIEYPHPNGWDSGIGSYRFYDSTGAPLKFYCFNNMNLVYSSVTLQTNLTVGNNTIYVTAGNTSLENKSDASVYTYYAENLILSSNPSLNTGYFNHLEIQIHQWNIYNNGWTNRMNIGTATEPEKYALVRNYSYLNMDWGESISVIVNDRSNPRYIRISPNSIDGAFGSIFAAGTMGNAISSSFSEFNENVNISGTQISITGQYYLNNSRRDILNITKIACADITPTETRFDEIVHLGNNLFIRFLDGATGEFYSAEQYYNGTPLVTRFSAMVLSQNLNANASAATTTLYEIARRTPIGFSQGSRIQNFTISGFNGICMIPDISYDVPFNIRISAVTGIQATNYQLNISSQSPQEVLNLSLFRNISNYTSINGIVSETSGEPITDGLVSIHYLNGTLMATAPIRAGGQYGQILTAGQYFVTYHADGYETLEGTLTSPARQDVQLRKFYNVTINAKDADTGAEIDFFTTFFGPNQTIRSTDNGTVTYQNMFAGENEIIVQADGYSQVTRTVYVGENSTDFTIFLRSTQATEFTTPHYVRFFYRTLIGSPVSGLDISIFEGNSISPSLQGITGTDGSVAFRMNETIKYKIVAKNDSAGISHEFTTYPKSSEYVVIISSRSQSDQSSILQNVSYKIADAAINSTHASITTDMMSSNPDDVIDYKITIYDELDTFTSASGTFSSSASRSFPVPLGSVYTVSITFTDVDGKSITVSKTIRLDSSELKTKFKIPGFTEQWHYNAICVVIVLISAFSFSERTARIGGIIIPAEFFMMVTIGWLQVSAFAICLVLAVVIFAVIYFFERMDQE